MADKDNLKKRKRSEDGESVSRVREKRLKSLAVPEQSSKLTDMMNDLLDDDDDEANAPPLQPVSVERKMLELIRNFTPQELKRYESFRRSHFDRFKVRKYLSSLTKDKITEKMSIIVSGATKVFIGEVVEIARDLMESRGAQGAVPPAYVREAYRLMQKARKVPHLK